MFGFIPFEEKYVSSFSIATYLDLLPDKTPEDCSKIYYFLKARLRLSKEVIDFLETALTYNRPFSLENMAAHPWLTSLERVSPFEEMNLHEEVRMISNVEQKHLSKCLAAIDKFKTRKAPLNLLTPMSGPSPQNVDQLRTMLREDFHLSKLHISDKFALGEEQLKPREIAPIKQVRK